MNRSTFFLYSSHKKFKVFFIKLYNFFSSIHVRRGQPFTCMTFSFSNMELIEGNKVDDNTVKVSSDRVQPLVLIKCEVPQMPHLNKCHHGLFLIDPAAVLLLAVRCHCLL